MGFKVVAYGSREFCAYFKRVLRVNGEVLLVHVQTQCYLAFFALTAHKFGAFTVSGEW